MHQGHHLCPGCRVRTPNSKFACPDCWGRLPRDVQQSVMNVAHASDTERRRVLDAAECALLDAVDKAGDRA